MLLVAGATADASGKARHSTVVWTFTLTAHNIGLLSYIGVTWNESGSRRHDELDVFM